MMDQYRFCRVHPEERIYWDYIQEVFHDVCSECSWQLTRRNIWDMNELMYQYGREVYIEALIQAGEKADGTKVRIRAGDIKEFLSKNYTRVN